MNEWLSAHLACPRDHAPLVRRGDTLACAQGHRYPIVDEIPILLVDDAEPTHDYATATLDTVRAMQQPDGAVPPSDATPRHGSSVDAGVVDPFVQAEIPYTSGNFYIPVQHRLTRYPIPTSRLWEGHGDRVLDIGCNWGRWSIAAAARGFMPIGLDPSLQAVQAARRVARQLQVDADFVVGDARFLPFRDESFSTIFSYSVFQHLSKANVAFCLDEVSRVLAPGGRTLIQMPNQYGFRARQRRRWRAYSEGEGFDVRYWTPNELVAAFTKVIGQTTLTADGYFGLNVQSRDIDLLPFKYQLVVIASEVLRHTSRVIRPLALVADSVYLASTKPSASRGEVSI